LTNQATQRSATQRTLLEDDAGHELRVVHRAPQLLDDADVVQVHVDGRVRVDHVQHRVDGDRRQHVRVLPDHLAGEARHDGVDERLAAAQVKRLGHPLQDLSCRVVG